MSDHLCKRCHQEFATAEKLDKHLKTAHRGQPNSDVRLRNVLIAGALLAAAVLVIFLMLRGDSGVGDDLSSNVEAFGLSDDPYLGSPDAPVVVVAFEAPKCSSCQYFHTQVLPQLNQTYFAQGRAVLYFSQYTVGYDFDYGGGIAQECVFREGGNDAFWHFTDIMYAQQRQFTEANVQQFLQQTAEAHDLDADALTRCYEDQETASLVNDDWRRARDFNVPGTPTFYVFGATGEPVRASVNTLEQVMQDLGA